MKREFLLLTGQNLPYITSLVSHEKYLYLVRSNLKHFHVGNMLDIKSTMPGHNVCFCLEMGQTQWETMFVLKKKTTEI